MNYECQVCFARFNETDMNRVQQEQQICPNCGHVDLKVITETETAKEVEPKGGFVAVAGDKATSTIINCYCTGAPKEAQGQKGAG